MAGPRQCLHCKTAIEGRAPQAKFCSHECLRASTDDRAKIVRLAKKEGRSCKHCNSVIPTERKAGAYYCSDACQDGAEKKRWREKIARYRAADPERYQAHRNKENDLRLKARVALKLITQVQTNGLEALL